MTTRHTLLVDNKDFTTLAVDRAGQAWGMGRAADLLLNRIIEVLGNMIKVFMLLEDRKVF